MREGPATIVRRLLDHVKRGQPWSCTFIHEIPKEQEKVVEAQLKEKFEIWANSWIIPDLKILLGKFEKRKGGPPCQD